MVNAPSGCCFSCQGGVIIIEADRLIEILISCLLVVDIIAPKVSSTTKSSHSVINCDKMVTFAGINMLD